MLVLKVFIHAMCTEEFVIVGICPLEVCLESTSLFWKGNQRITAGHSSMYAIMQSVLIARKQFVFYSFYKVSKIFSSFYLAE